ncbi:LAMI_0F14730g1_1 [Lachancea mirantina]|uniref:Guanine deaminase n=1 Tax=Lachancea mirantina TaxID=1230905 RepID=A0A1G4K3Z0_9SACH|nr:LAMI_0F14730g1_1 [Lachancea mirantina]
MAGGNKEQTKFQVFYGTFVDTPKLDELRVRPRTSVGVSKNGTIAFIKADSENPLQEALEFDKTLQPWEIEVFDTFQEQGSSFFFPGFIDTHVHASQYPNAGIFGTSTLLDWLEKYTFPLESSLADLQIARRVYTRVLDKSLSNGTTTAAYYTTTSSVSSNLMADMCAKRGQRAFIGKVCMDRHAPDYYVETTQESQESLLSVIDHIRNKLRDDKIQPIVTPRFAPCCSRELMSWLGKLASEQDLHIQTHLDENQSEIAWVKELFPESESYSHVYDDHDLLTEKTVLAHCVHLKEEEAALLKRRKCGISHCPISNSSITSGECRVRWLLDQGIKVGLGTDLSGGFSASILATARQSLLVSRHVAMKETDPKYSERAKLSVAEVLFLASYGGAAVLNLEDQVGSFEIGKQFDAQLIDLESPTSNVDVFDWQHLTWNDKQQDKCNFDKFQDLIAKWLFNGDDRNTARVWVASNIVYSSA